MTIRRCEFVENAIADSSCYLLDLVLAGCERNWQGQSRDKPLWLFSQFAAAPSGCRMPRVGLHGLLAALARDEIHVVIVLTTNGLFRKVYRSRGFVEEEIVDRGKRDAFVQSTVDTADENRAPAVANACDGRLSAAAQEWMVALGR